MLHVDHFLWVSSPHVSGISVYDADEPDVPGFPALATFTTPNTTCMVLYGDDEVWCGCEGCIQVYSAATLEKLAEIPEPGASVCALAVVGNTVWSAGFRRGSEQEIHVWDAATRKCIQAFAAH
jgi:hypothetical protein